MIGELQLATISALAWCSICNLRMHTRIKVIINSVQLPLLAKPNVST